VVRVEKPSPPARLRPGNAKAIYRETAVDRFILEATRGIEPLVRVLQTLALPLGDVAR
jgi:hypothetical protein